MNKVKLSLLSAAVSVIFSSISYASIEVQPVNDKVSISVSSDDFSILEIKNGSISFVNGNASLVEVDQLRTVELGKAIFKPASKKDFSLFLTDSNGKTFTVSVNPSKKVGADVYIINDGRSKVIDGNTNPKQDKSLVIKSSDSREKAILKLVKTMLSDNPEPSKGSYIEEDNKEVKLWDEVKLTQLSHLKSGVFVAKKYAIKNVSNLPMVLSEEEFDGKNVAAVSISKLALAPEESTTVIVVSLAQEND